MEKLYWLNRHYIKERATAESLARLSDLAEITAKNPKLAEILTGGWEFFDRAGYLPNVSAATGTLWLWYLKIVALFLPSVDKLDQLPERAALIFHYDAAAALAAPDNAEVLAGPKTKEVLVAFAELVESGPQL